MGNRDMEEKGIVARDCRATIHFSSISQSVGLLNIDVEVEEPEACENPTQSRKQLLTVIIYTLYYTLNTSAWHRGRKLLRATPPPNTWTRP